MISDAAYHKVQASTSSFLLVICLRVCQTVSEIPDGDYSKEGVEFLNGSKMPKQDLKSYVSVSEVKK